MQRTSWLAFLACASAALATGGAAAQDMVYTPVNPSFGGNPFNSSHLLSIAQQQNEYDNQTFTPLDPQQQFADSLERRILSRTSQLITERIFGEGAGEDDSGEFTIGDQQIAFQRTGEQVEIVLTDLATGATSNLTIPTPQF